jgi:hypothetical protein
MTKKKPSSEAMATAFLTVLSLVGGLAVACTAGVGTRTVSRAAAQPPPPPPVAASPSPSPTAEPTVPPDRPRLRFPADAVVDVKAAYGARGDGSTDDTAALQKAITENPDRTVYLPAGTYLVSRALEARTRGGAWQSGLRLVGEDRDSTVVKLKDKASGFTNRWNPRPLLRTGNAPVTAAGPGRPETNAAFGNMIDNVTVDTGDNAGAVGVDFAGSDVASLRRLTVKGDGTDGITLTRAFPGPALLSRVEVRGFDHGIRVGQGQYGLTLEHITLTDQNISGLENGGNVLAIHDLSSNNTVPAVRSMDRQGFVTLIDATLGGGSADFSAIQSNGELLARRVRSTGYRSALTQGGKIVPGAEAQQYVSRPAYVLAPEAPSQAVDLGIRDTPEYFPADPATWASAVAFGARPDDDTDDTDAIQKAVDAGKPVVYLPAGRYVVSRTIRVHGAVRLFAGLGSTVAPGGTAFGDAAHPTALLQVDDVTGPDVTISGLTVGKGEKSPGLIGVVQHTARPLVLRDVACCGSAYTASFHAQPGAGPLYVENVSASRWQFDQPQQVWARQLNHEDTDARDRTVRIRNAAATLWVLGLESEQNGPVLRAEGSGRTEVLGGAVYESGSGNDVAFEATGDASVALSFATTGPASSVYRVLVRQHRGAAGRDLARTQAVWRGDGRTVPLYTG